MLLTDLIVILLLIQFLAIIIRIRHSVLMQQHTELREQLLCKKLSELRKAAEFQQPKDVEDLMERATPAITEMVDNTPELITSQDNIYFLDDLSVIITISVVTVLCIALIFVVFSSGGSSTGGPSTPPPYEARSPVYSPSMDGSPLKPGDPAYDPSWGIPFWGPSQITERTREAYERYYLPTKVVDEAGKVTFTHPYKGDFSDGGDWGDISP